MLTMSLLQYIPTYLLAVALIILLIAFYFIGRTVRKKMRHQAASGDLLNVGNTLLGLLALLLAFSFGMSNNRYDVRRSLLVDELNAIGTAVQRADVYPDSIRTKLRKEFKNYIETRILYYRLGVDNKLINEYYNQSQAVSSRIWKVAAQHTRSDRETEKVAQLLPALNSMGDIASSRLSAHLAKIPDTIIYFLLLLSLSSAFLMGYERKNSIDWVSIMGFSMMLSLTIFVIIDLDRPRSGLISLDEQNMRMTDLLEQFKD